MKSCTQSKFTPFITGDKVWLEARNLKRNVINPKFTAKREGPFKITKVLSSLSYQLEIPKSWKIHLVFHASLLTPYKENDIHGPNYPQPPPDLINGEEEYEIEQILKHQGRPKRHQYLVRWKGYAVDKDSWQNKADLGNALELLQEYKRKAKLLWPLRITHHQTRNIMPSRSPPSTPCSDIDHPHLVYYGPLSDSPEQSVVTVPDSPLATHVDKSIQTSTKHIIVQNISIQTITNPPLTLQQKEPPDLPILLQLRDLLKDLKLFTPVIAHCDVHSPILNLYKSFHQTINLKPYQDIESIKIPI